MKISINVKSGTGGYCDYDGCDLLLREIEDDKFPIPRIGETIEIFEDNDDGKINAGGTRLQEFHNYLVTDVRYRITESAYGVTVYVVPIGRAV